MTQHINLLPKVFLKQRLITNRLKQWGVFLVCLWLGLFCFYSLKKAKYDTERKEVEALQVRSLPIAQKKGDILTTQQKINELIQRQQLGMGLE